MEKSWGASGFIRMPTLNQMARNVRQPFEAKQDVVIRAFFSCLLHLQLDQTDLEFDEKQ